MLVCDPSKRRGSCREGSRARECLFTVALDEWRSWEKYSGVGRGGKPWILGQSGLHWKYKASKKHISKKERDGEKGKRVREGNSLEYIERMVWLHHVISPATASIAQWKDVSSTRKKQKRMESCNLVFNSRSLSKQGIGHGWKGPGSRPVVPVKWSSKHTVESGKQTLCRPYILPTPLLASFSEL